MKHLLITLLLLISFNSLADAWDNLTMTEAKAVVAELKQNTYIFDYCDCCSHDGEDATGIEFIKVIHTEIVTCDWNNEMYSVKIIAQLIARVEHLEKGANIHKLTPSYDKDYHTTFYMNYTWGMHPDSNLATPFFNIIDYDYYGNDNTPCKALFSYPTPKQLKKTVKVKGYKKWWKTQLKN
jgi:hypothetical protein